MNQFLSQWKIRRNRKREKLDEWKQETIDRILNEILPSNIPYHYDSAFSFLQRSRNCTRSPVRLTLFFPTYPLAIDIVGMDGRNTYLEASPYITRNDWDRLQADLSLKLERLQERRCPYLVIRDTDPTDPDSLRGRLNILTGRNLKP